MRAPRSAAIRLGASAATDQLGSTGANRCFGGPRSFPGGPRRARRRAMDAPGQVE
ncbi:hypothetical protein SCE1572_11420 [Sorangium cellulosum So0157-2]|uniref:Uncharacterized protein n=1 Tax=Sorangium cellulosum So0157-2 TaxID=1254432 RepID=S4XT54_SORCE|nr:hypothetical protein SCE1572_11420 [Sorangium cellulosum So0157-2]